jgi:glycosyltransferase involved in cell wall biosynthesis
MKIAFLSHKDVHMLKWVEFFRHRNEVLILELKRTKFKFLDILLNMLSVKNQLKRIKPDILQVHSAGIHGILAAFSGFHPFVLTAYGSDILIAPKSPIVRPFIKFVLKKADLITCDAEHMKKAMIKLGAEKEKIKIIYFGVDTKKFAPGEKNKEIKNKLKLSGGPVIISLRNFYPVYDIESFIKAIPIIIKDFPKANFIIVGHGPEENKLKKTASDLDVSERVGFIGEVNQDEIPDFLRISDVYASTALSDAGIASSTAEAMACGLPVVITDFGENSQWVKNGKSGFLIPLKNPEALAEKIIYLLKSKELREKMGQCGRKIIKEKNDYYKEMNKVENIYMHLYEKAKTADKN